jgi:hypothetical protein
MGTLVMHNRLNLDDQWAMIKLIMANGVSRDLATEWLYRGHNTGQINGLWGHLLELDWFEHLHQYCPGNRRVNTWNDYIYYCNTCVKLSIPEGNNSYK